MMAIGSELWCFVLDEKLQDISWSTLAVGPIWVYNTLNDIRLENSVKFVHSGPKGEYQ